MIQKPSQLRGSEIKSLHGGEMKTRKPGESNCKKKQEANHTEEIYRVNALNYCRRRSEEKRESGSLLGSRRGTAAPVRKAPSGNSSLKEPGRSG